MIYMELETIEFISGLFSLIIVVISVIVGLKIASKYFEHKQKTFILVGITWIGVVSPWYPSSVSFLLVLITGEALIPVIYFILGISFLPFFMFVWLTAFTEFLYKEKQKIILLLFSITGVIFESLFIYFLLVDPSQIGELTGPVNVEYKTFVLIYVLFLVITLVSTGLLFARESLRSDKPEIKLKGKLLILAFLTYAVAGLVDAILPINITTVVIMRLVAISSAILFYGGFCLPKWMKNIFSKKE